MHLLKKYIHNRFFYTGIIFLIWITFFDSNNLVEQYKLSEKLTDLHNREQFYTEEISRLSKEIEAFKTNSALLEKFARERYFMKKDQEDVYVILREK